MSLINKRAVRKLALDLANAKYPKDQIKNCVDSTGRQWDYSRAQELSKKRRFSQVSSSFMDQIEAQIRVIITARIDAMPKSGKTVK